MARLPDYLKMETNKVNEFTITVDDFPDCGNIKVTLNYKFSRKFLFKKWLVMRLLLIVGWLMRSSVEFDIIKE